MSAGVSIAVIVEGHAEDEAVPVLIRRIAGEYQLPVDVRPSLRVGRQRILRAGELERYVELAARKLRNPGGILILLDADNDCAAALGRALLQRARTQRADVPIGVVIAVREFEAFFLAAVASLRGLRGVENTACAPRDPESIRGAKERLGALMTRSYHEVSDQPAFSKVFDMDEAARLRSFRKCRKEIRRLMDPV